jgi:REP element-mobilizing transposase RayT
VTVCTKDRHCLFGDVINGECRLDQFGQIVEEEWKRSTVIRREIKFDDWVVMPNHMHGIVYIVHDEIVGAHGCAPLQHLYRSPRSLGSFISGFKSSTTRRINQLRGTPGARVWQRNYYDRIIRNTGELNKLRRYILDNPLQWELDEYHPLHRG